jgi:hypothetical protein
MDVSDTKRYGHDEFIHNKKRTSNMKVHLHFPRRLFALALTLSVAVVLQAQTAYFVSPNGNDSNDGATWHSAWKSIDYALMMAATNASHQVDIYFAEGSYTYTGTQAKTFYGKSILLHGGYPTPTATTQPTDICAPSVEAHKTDIVVSKNATTPFIEIGGKDVSVTIENFHFNRADGSINHAFIDFLRTDDKGVRTYNPTLTFNNVVIDYFETGPSGFAFFRGSSAVPMFNPTVNINRMIVKSGKGGFIGTETNSTKGMQITVTNSSFRNITNDGAVNVNSLFSINYNSRTDVTETFRPSTFLMRDCYVDGLNNGIAAGQQAPVAQLYGFSEVTLERTIIANTKGYQSGAIYAVAAKNVTVKDSKFYNCLAGAKGGAITVEGEVYADNQGAGLISITGSTFKKCVANDLYGGALVLDNGASTTNKLTLLIDKSHFNSCSDGARSGGTVYTNIAGAQTVTNSSFCDNKTNAHGAALYLQGSVDGYTVTGSYFSGNIADNGGSALQFNDAACNTLVENNVFFNNTVTSGLTQAGSHGGTLLYQGGAAGVSHIVRGNRFDSNKANYGAGISLYEMKSGAAITIENNSFTTNYATNKGGAISVYTGGGNGIAQLTAKGNYYNGNYAAVGGAVYVYTGRGLSYSSDGELFVGNHANTGGAVQLENNLTLGGGKTTVNNTTFWGNYYGSNVLTDQKSDFYNLGLNATDFTGTTQLQAALTDYRKNSMAATVTQITSAPTYDASVYAANATNEMCADIPDEYVDHITPMPDAQVTATTADPNADASGTHLALCQGKEYGVTFSSTSGIAPFTYTYKVTRYEGDQVKVTDNLTAVTPDNANQVTITATEANPNVLLVYTVTHVTDSMGNKTDTYCDENNPFGPITHTVFTRECNDFDNDGVIDIKDLDIDNDGILNEAECPTTETAASVANTKWVIASKAGVEVSTVYNDAVADDGYMNAAFRTGSGTVPASGTYREVLTLYPAMFGLSSTSPSVTGVDISKYFGYPDGSKAVVVDIINAAVGEGTTAGEFVTTGSNMKTQWRVYGSAKPYVLMQSVNRGQAFTEGSSFGINMFNSLPTSSQTAAYIDTTLDPTYYELYESTNSKKVVYQTAQGDVLLNKIGLSYLSTNPMSKSFEFEQSGATTGEVVTSVTVILPCDKDHDGVPNIYDFDADADGCIDAIEGGQSVKASQTADGMISGEVDANGVPVLVGAAGQEVGEALNETVKAGCSYWVGGLSTDYNTAGNWSGNYIPTTGEDLIFATVDNNGQPVAGNAQAGPAVRDMLLPAATFLSQGALVNETDAALGKIVNGATVAGVHPATVIPAGAGLTITAATGFTTAADQDKLLLKASEDGSAPSGTFVMNNSDACNQKVYATIEFKPLGTYVADRTVTDNDQMSPDYLKTLYAEFDWQYIGVPVYQVDKSPSFKGMYVRSYSEEKNDPLHYYRKWTDVFPGTMMTAFKAYEVAPVSNKAVTTIGGQLNFCEQTLPLTRKAAEVTASKETTSDKRRYGLGVNIIANSYTAGLKISDVKVTSNEEGATVDPTVYIYKTGSFDDWQKAKNDNGGTAKGGYQAVLISKAGQDGLPATIAPMQGFMVKYDSPTYSTVDGQISFPYVGSVQTQTIPLRAKAMMIEGSQPVGVVLVRLNDGKVYDEARFYEDTQSTNAYDIGRDAEKLAFGSPSVYATTTEGRKVEISSVPNINGMTFGVETVRDSSYTLHLEMRRMAYTNMKLVDVVNQQVVPMSEGKVDYFFVAGLTGFESNRFMLVDTPETDYTKIVAATDVEAVNMTLQVGTASFYTLSGAKVGDYALPLHLDQLRSQLQPGVYLVKYSDGNVTYSRKYVIE